MCKSALTGPAIKAQTHVNQLQAGFLEHLQTEHLLAWETKDKPFFLGGSPFQDLLDSKFEKRRRGVYGPRLGLMAVPASACGVRSTSGQEERHLHR